jgi:hypothetical protein
MTTPGTPVVTVCVDHQPDGDRIAVRAHGIFEPAPDKPTAARYLALGLLSMTSNAGVLDVAAAVDLVREAAAQAVAVADKPCRGHLRAVGGTPPDGETGGSPGA